MTYIKQRYLMITEVILIGLAMIEKYFCGSCKKELKKTDAMRICDICLYGEE